MIEAPGGSGRVRSQMLHEIVSDLVALTSTTCGRPKASARSYHVLVGIFPR